MQTGFAVSVMAAEDLGIPRADFCHQLSAYGYEVSKSILNDWIAWVRKKWWSSTTKFKLNCFIHFEVRDLLRSTSCS